MTDRLEMLGELFAGLIEDARTAQFIEFDRPFKGVPHVVISAPVTTLGGKMMDPTKDRGGTADPSTEVDLPFRIRIDPPTPDVGEVKRQADAIAKDRQLAGRVFLATMELNSALREAARYGLEVDLGSTNVSTFAEPNSETYHAEVYRKTRIDPAE